MDLNTQYNLALDYLYSFVDYSLKHSSELAKAEFNLDRMFALMDALGNPQNQPKIIHITGTKGKGSTAAFCNSALISAGYKVGLYTSPHLLEFTERIQVNSQNISQADFVELVDAIKPFVAAVPMITTFELTTALAFWHFARQKVDVAVIEVGLGGRLDATNIVTPAVSVITTISYDHTAVLGNTLSLIAGEKSGIIKAGVPVVIGPQSEEARNVIAETARQKGCQLYDSSVEFTLEPLQQSLLSQTFRLTPKASQTAIELSIPLLGRHQMENAVTAYCALKHCGLPITDSRITAGFANVEWQCRFEIAQLQPVLVFDSAHNEDAFRRLAQTVRDYFDGKKMVLILGISEDKHLSEMIAQVSDLLDTLIITRADHPRALPTEDILAKLGRQPFNMIADPNIPHALATALEIAKNNGSIVISAGSMFVTAEVKQAWMKREQNERQ